jgi:hypothetical protein
VASIPVYSTNLAPLLKRFISPISPKIVAAIISPILGTVVIGDLILVRISLISFSTLVTWFSIKLICSISNFN